MIVVDIYAMHIMVYHTALVVGLIPHNKVQYNTVWLIPHQQRSKIGQSKFYMYNLHVDVLSSRQSFDL